MDWILLVGCVLLVAANAVFVAAEFSFVTVDRNQVEAAVEAGDRRSRGVLAGLRTLSTQLSGAQLGITVTSLIVGFLAEPALAALLDDPLADIGVSATAVDAVSVVVALLIATVFQMVLGELVPKNLAIARPLGVARAVAPLQRGFTKATGPIIRFLNGCANWVLRRFGVEPQEELAAGRSPEELLSLVRRSARVGTLPHPTANLLDQALHFSERTAADVLTPRRRVRFVPARMPVAELIELARVSGHSRFPVTGPGGADEIVGIAALRAALKVPHDQRANTYAGMIAEPPLQVPETLELDVLLRRLRSGGSQLAVVVEEYGGTAGIVTLEDLVEELVGEVEDEHDRAVPRIRAVDDGYVLSGLLRPDEIDHLDLIIPESDRHETVGGFIAEELGRIASIGDTVEIPGWQLTVTRMDGLRVEWLRADPSGERADDTADAGDRVE